MPGHATDDEIDAALLFYELEHSSCHHGDDDKLAHADDTVAHRLHPSEDIERASKQTYDSCEDDAESEHSHNIHSEDSGDEYCEVGDNLHPLYVGYMLRGTYARAHEDIDDEDDYRCRYDDERVDAELIREAASL